MTAHASLRQTFSSFLSRMIGAAQSVASSVEEFVLFTSAELLKLTPPKPLIDGMMFEQGIYALVAPPGTGKSFLEQHIALSVALGRSVHGHATTQGPVVRVLSERIYLAPARQRAWAALHDTPSVASGEDIGVYTTPASLMLQDTSSVVRFVECLKQRGVRPKLLTIDHLALNMVGMDDSNSKSMVEVMTGVRLLADLLETTVLLLHHPTKASAMERGSGALRGIVDGLWFLAEDHREPGRLVLTCEKENAGPGFGPQYYRIQPAADGAAFVEVEGPKEAPKPLRSRKASQGPKAAARPASVEAILRVLTASPVAITRPEIEAALGEEFSHATVQNRVKQMLDAGELHQHPDRRVWHRPPLDTP